MGIVVFNPSEYYADKSQEEMERDIMAMLREAGYASEENEEKALAAPPVPVHKR